MIPNEKPQISHHHPKTKTKNKKQIDYFFFGWFMSVTWCLLFFFFIIAQGFLKFEPHWTCLLKIYILWPYYISLNNKLWSSFPVYIEPYQLGMTYPRIYQLLVKKTQIQQEEIISVNVFCIEKNLPSFVLR